VPVSLSLSHPRADSMKRGESAANVEEIHVEAYWQLGMTGSFSLAATACLDSSVLYLVSYVLSPSAACKP
jgi:hypothetical protein